VQSTQFPSPLGCVAGHQPTISRNIGEAIGRELRAAAINWNVAPVIEPVTELTEPLDVSRRFGSEPDTISNYTGAFIEGSHAAGVTTCTTEALTSPLREAYRRTIDDVEVDEDFLDLVEHDLEPLRKLLADGLLDCIMLSSTIFDFDDTERSKKCIRFVIDQVIRGSLGFEGPVVMNCATLPLDSNNCSVHAPLRAFLCGSDMVCLPIEQDVRLSSINAIYANLEEDSALRSAVEKSSDRVAALKSQYLSWPVELSSPSPELAQSLISAHASTALAAYHASITSLQPGPSPLLSLPAGSVILLMTPTVPPLRAHVGPADPFEPLGRALSRHQPRVRHVPYTLSTGLTTTHMAFLERVGAVILVLACPSSALTEVQLELWAKVENVLVGIEDVSDRKVRRLVISAGDVRDLFQPEMSGKGWWGVACWDYTRGALEAVADVISGEREAAGRLPIQMR
jgi:beta-N-acetylhexosaminidase